MLIMIESLISGSEPQVEPIAIIHLAAMDEVEHTPDRLSHLCPLRVSDLWTDSLGGAADVGGGVTDEDTDGCLGGHRRITPGHTLSASAKTLAHSG